jgi:hypothetical protein
MIYPSTILHQLAHYLDWRKQPDPLPERDRSETGPRTRVLLVAIDYESSVAHSLKSSAADLQHMQHLATAAAATDILIVADGAANGTADLHPSAYNIKRSLRWLLDGSVDGDRLLFYFTGHGTQVGCFSREIDGRDECIVPCCGPLIRDNTLQELVLDCVRRKAVHLTCIVDACSSGTVFDLDTAQGLDREQFKGSVCVLSSSDASEASWGNADGSMFTSRMLNLVGSGDRPGSATWLKDLQDYMSIQRGREQYCTVRSVPSGWHKGRRLSELLHVSKGPY